MVNGGIKPWGLIGVARGSFGLLGLPGVALGYSGSLVLLGLLWAAGGCPRIDFIFVMLLVMSRCLYKTMQP